MHIRNLYEGSKIAIQQCDLQRTAVISSFLHTFIIRMAEKHAPLYKVVGAVLLYWCTSWLAIFMNK